MYHLTKYAPYTHIQFTVYFFHSPIDFWYIYIFCRGLRFRSLVPSYKSIPWRKKTPDIKVYIVEVSEKVYTGEKQHARDFMCFHPLAAVIVPYIRHIPVYTKLFRGNGFRRVSSLSPSYSLLPISSFKLFARNVKYETPFYFCIFTSAVDKTIPIGSIRCTLYAVNVYITSFCTFSNNIIFSIYNITMKLAVQREYMPDDVERPKIK